MDTMNAQELGNRPASEMTRREVIVLMFLPQVFTEHTGESLKICHAIAGNFADDYLSILAREAQEAGDER